MKEKENYKGTIISAAVGGAFFAIPYLALSVPVLPAIGMAALGFGACIMQSRLGGCDWRSIGAGRCAECLCVSV